MVPDQGTPGQPQGRAEDSSFLVSAGALYEIDFDEQSARTIDVPPRIEGLGAMYVPVFVPQLKNVDYAAKTVVRLREELVLLNADGTRWRSIPLPSAVRDRAIMVYGTLKPEIIIAALDDSWSHRDLYWIDPAGAVVRQAAVPLTTPPRRVGGGGWLTALMFPAPWVSAISMRTNDATQKSSFVDKWSPSAAVGTLSALLAVIAYRRQRALADAGAWIWAALVFVLGPPGFVGYLVHRCWPAKTPCEHCGALVPRDRAACRACGVDFPPPAPRGIEIFA
jgi:hypothetical protein